MIGLLAGFFLRRKQFSDIDVLESRKIDLMSKPVFEEISRVKLLNLDGETEESFAKWRQQWDHMLTSEFPEIEMLLFDAEEYTDKFRFDKTSSIKKAITSKLDKIETTINQIFEEISGLISTASNCAEKLVGLKERFKELKKHIIIYNHSYSASMQALEKEIADCCTVFPEIEKTISTGDYFTASNMLDEVDDSHNELVQKTILVPELYTKCCTNLPDTLDLLEKSYAEMVHEEFPLKHIEFEKKFSELEAEIEKNLALLDDAQAFEVKESVSNIEKTIEDICAELEQEEDALVYISEKQQMLPEEVDDLAKKVSEVSRETARLILTYYISNEDLLTKGMLEENTKLLQDRWRGVRNSFIQKDTAYSILQENIIEIELALKNQIDTYNMYSNKLNTLCEDEKRAIKELNEMREHINDVSVQVRQANIPGIPSKYEILFEEAKNAIEVVEQKLVVRPLEMESVLFHLEDASEKMKDLQLLSKHLIEEVLITEKVIQYGNRYRLKNAELSLALTEAETKFNAYLYSDALEIASLAIEQVEPGFFHNSDGEIAFGEQSYAEVEEATEREFSTLQDGEAHQEKANSAEQKSLDDEKYFAKAYNEIETDLTATVDPENKDQIVNNSVEESKIIEELPKEKMDFADANDAVEGNSNGLENMVEEDNYIDGDKFNDEDIKRIIDGTAKSDSIVSLSATTDVPTVMTWVNRKKRGRKIDKDQTEFKFD